eukprot:12914436-Prorocentrum_lima.AAC.1
MEQLKGQGRPMLKDMMEVTKEQSKMEHSMTLTTIFKIPTGLKNNKHEELEWMTNLHVPLSEGGIQKATMEATESLEQHYTSR